MQNNSIQLPNGLMDHDSANQNVRLQPLEQASEDDSPYESAQETQRSNFDTARQLLHEEHHIELSLQREGGE